MSIVKQALSDSVIPIPFTLLNNIDVTDEWDSIRANPTMSNKEKNAAILEVPVKYPGVAVSSIATGVLVGMSQNEKFDPRKWAHRDLVARYRSGFPWQTSPKQGTISNSMRNILIALQEIPRWKVEQFIAPLFIYARSHIETCYGDYKGDDQNGSINIIDLDTIDTELHNLKTEEINDRHHIVEEVEKKFVSHNRYVYHLKFGRSIRITSSGVLFSEKLQWSSFDAVKAFSPSDPFAHNAPSARAVVGELLRELRSQSDSALAGIVLSLLTGVRAYAETYRSTNPLVNEPRLLVYGHNVFNLIEGDYRPNLGVFKKA